MNRIYNICIDEHFDQNLKLFAESLSQFEEITQTSVVPTIGGNSFVICTKKIEREVDTKQRNLLLEEMAKNPKSR